MTQIKATEAFCDADCGIETLASRISDLRWTFDGIDEDCPHVDQQTSRVRVVASMFLEIIEREAAELSEKTHKARVASIAQRSAADGG
jgi:hypothetical protein